jgi:hypothetical protein
MVIARHSKSVKATRFVVTAVLVVAGVAAGTLYKFWDRVVEVAGLTINVARSSDAPPGTLTIDNGAIRTGRGTCRTRAFVSRANTTGYIARLA